MSTKGDERSRMTVCTTYENRRISAVDLRACPLDGQRLLAAHLIRRQEIGRQRAKECTGDEYEG